MKFESVARNLEPVPEKKPKLKIQPEEVSVELLETDLEEIREPGELQEGDVVDAFEIKGFRGLEVAATLEKKDERKGNGKDRNQDDIIADPETGLFGVLDGLGGEDSGDLASKSAETAIPEEFQKALARTKKMSGGDIQSAIIEHQLGKMGMSDPTKAMEARRGLTQMVEAALSKDPAMGRKALALLESMSQANEYVKETKGKTTACVGMVHETPDGSRYAIIANIGDSAAFKRRKNGEMVQLTEEDSLLNTLQKSGALKEDLFAQMKGAPDKKFPIPVTMEIIQAMGGGKKEFDLMKGKDIPMSYKKLKASMDASLGADRAAASLSIRELKPGDELLFGTDGLVDKFENPNTDETNLAELAKDAGVGRTMTERLNHLRQAAKKRTTYKKDDDIALVSVRVPEKG